MTIPHTFPDANDVPIDDVPIDDTNPEDTSPDDPEYYNSPEDDEATTPIHGLLTSGYPTTYPILRKVITHFPSASHVYITSTTGGTHATTSFHYRGEAVDVGSASQSYKDQLAAWLYKYSSHITELIHTNASDSGGWYVKYGSRKPHGFYGSTTDRAHINHVHLAVATIAQANALLAAVSSSTPTPTPSKPSTLPVLHSGATGDSVKTLQTKLNKHGAKLKVDGAFGPSTFAAVKAFQSANHLAVDGVVGPRTWAKLG